MNPAPQTAANFHRYVALGDSLTEGLCDISSQNPGDYFGWADRLAYILAYAYPDRPQPFHYANLALRSKKVADVVNNQLPRALELEPDFISIFIGANDLSGVKADPDLLAAELEGGVQQAVAAGCTLLLVTNFKPQFRFLHNLRRRAELYNENLRQIAQTHNTLLLDFWMLSEFRDRSHWAEDRVHMSSQGHRTLAYRAAEVLGVENARLFSQMEFNVHEQTPEQDQINNLYWMWKHARPWMLRKLRGRSAGDGLSAKHDDYILLERNFRFAKPHPIIDDQPNTQHHHQLREQQQEQDA